MTYRFSLLLLSIFLLFTCHLYAVIGEEKDPQEKILKINHDLEYEETQKEEVIKACKNQGNPQFSPTGIHQHGNEHTSLDEVPSSFIATDNTQNENPSLLDSLDPDLLAIQNNIRALNGNPSIEWLLTTYGYWVEKAKQYQKLQSDFMFDGSEAEKKLNLFFPLWESLKDSLIVKIESLDNNTIRPNEGNNNLHQKLLHINNPIGSKEGSSKSSSNSGSPARTSCFYDISPESESWDGQDLHILSFSVDLDQLKQDLQDILNDLTSVKCYLSPEELQQLSNSWIEPYQRYLEFMEAEPKKNKKNNGLIPETFLTVQYSTKNDQTLKKTKTEKSPEINSPRGMSQLLNDFCLAYQELRKKIEKQLSELANKEVSLERLSHAPLTAVNRNSSQKVLQKPPLGKNTTSLDQKTHFDRMPLNREEQVIEEIENEIARPISEEYLKELSSLLSKKTLYWNNASCLLPETKQKEVKKLLEKISALKKEINHRHKLATQREAQQQQEAIRKSNKIDSWKEQYKSLSAAIKVERNLLSKVNLWEEAFLAGLDDSLTLAAKEMQKLTLNENAIDLFFRSVEASQEGMKLLTKEKKDLRLSAYASIRATLVQAAQESLYDFPSKKLIKGYLDTVEFFQKAIEMYDESPEAALLFYHGAMTNGMITKEFQKPNFSNSLSESLYQLKEIVCEGVKDWKRNTNDNNKTLEQRELETKHYNIAFLTLKNAIDPMLLEGAPIDSTIIKKQINIARSIAQAAQIEAWKNPLLPGIAYFAARCPRKAGESKESALYYEQAGDCLTEAARATNKNQKQNFQQAAHYFLQATQEAEATEPKSATIQANLRMAFYHQEKSKTGSSKEAEDKDPFYYEQQAKDCFQSAQNILDNNSSNDRYENYKLAAHYFSQAAQEARKLKPNATIVEKNLMMANNRRDKAKTGGS